MQMEVKTQDQGERASDVQCRSCAWQCCCPGPRSGGPVGREMWKLSCARNMRRVVPAVFPMRGPEKTAGASEQEEVDKKMLTASLPLARLQIVLGG